MQTKKSYFWWQEHGSEWIDEINNRKNSQVYYHIQELLLMDYFQSSKFSKILEFGCGFGRHLKYLREIPGLEVFGYDQSESMVNRIKTWADSDWFEKHIKVGQPNSKLPYEDQSFDIVFTTSVLIHIPPEDLLEIVKELVRVSRYQILHQEPAPNYKVISDAHDGCWNHDIVKIYRSIGYECEILESAVECQRIYRVILESNASIPYTPPSLFLQKLFDLEKCIQPTIDTLAIEKNGLAKQNDELIKQKDKLTKQNDELLEVRDTLYQKNSELVQKCNDLLSNCDRQTLHNDYLATEVHKLSSFNNSLNTELDEIKSSRTWRLIVKLKRVSFLNFLGQLLLTILYFFSKKKFISSFKLVKNSVSDNNTRHSQFNQESSVLELKLNTEKNNKSNYSYKNNPLFKYYEEEPISVIIICHNKSQELPYVIQAIAKNTIRPDLIVLCDDGSTDNSVNVFNECCQSNNLAYKVIQYPSNNKPFRLNSLRNSGVSACPNGLVIILDADHVPARTHIEAHVNLHLSNSTPVLSTGPRLEYANADCSGPVNFLWGHEPITMMQASKKDPVPSWQGVLVSNMGMPKEAIINLGGFDSIYDGNYGYDDVDFTYRAWQAGYFFASSFEAYVIHIPHPPSLGQRNGQINKKKFEEKYLISHQNSVTVERMTRAPWHKYINYIRTKYLVFPIFEIAPVTKGGIGQYILSVIKKLQQYEYIPLLIIYNLSEEDTNKAKHYFASSNLKCRIHHVNEFSNIKLSTEDIYNLEKTSLVVKECLEKVVVQHDIVGVEWCDFAGMGFKVFQDRQCNPHSVFKRIPMWVHLHGTREIVDLTDRYPVSLKSGDGYVLSNYAERLSLDMADAWKSPSQAVANWYNRYYSISNKVVLSPLPYRKLSEPNSHIQDTHFHHPLKLLCPGRIQYLKGTDIIVLACLRICEKFKNKFHATFAGFDTPTANPKYTSSLDEVKSFIPEDLATHFSFTGKFSPEQYLQIAKQSNLAIFASRCETFCLAAHELNWLGIPLILPDIPAFEDHFIHGTNCYKFDGTPEGLALLLEQILINPDLLHKITTQPVEDFDVTIFYQLINIPPNLKDNTNYSLFNRLQYVRS